MFLRISGSSSITSILFMVRSKDGKPDYYGCAFAELADHLQLSAVQFGAPFHQNEAKTGPRTASDVAAATKGLKQLPLILLRNANAPITNDAHGVRPVALNRELHRRSGLRILNGVTQEVGKDVPEQLFICLRSGWNGLQRQLDGAPAVGRREDLIHDAAAKDI